MNRTLQTIDRLADEIRKNWGTIKDIGFNFDYPNYGYIDKNLASKLSSGTVDRIQYFMELYECGDKTRKPTKSELIDIITDF